MTTKQITEKPVNWLHFLSVVAPFIIVTAGWAVSINVRVKTVEVEIDNIKMKSGKMEETLDNINKNLASIAISINTLTVKWEENEKQNNRKLENYNRGL